jgi:hypothetical protein
MSSACASTQATAIPAPQTLIATAPIIPPTPSATSTPTNTPIPIPERAHYTIDMTLNYFYKSATVQETIVYPNHTGETLTTIELAVQPNLWNGGFKLHSVMIDGKPISQIKLEGHKLELSLNDPIQPNQMIELALGFDLQLPPMGAYKNPNDVKGQIYGYSDRQVNFVDWYPFIVPYTQEDQWTMYNPWYYGEHLMYDAADYAVSVTFSDGAKPVIASSGELISSENDVYRYKMEKARTFAFSMGYEYVTYSTQVGDVTITSYVYPFWKISGKAVMEKTAQAVELYTALFGAYPHKTLSAVQGDFNDGMEYDGLYFLSRDFYNNYQDPLIENNQSPRNYMTAIAVHETAHQWWFALIGNDQAIDPWLDEALCTYTEKLYYERYAPDDVKWWMSYRIAPFPSEDKIDRSIYDATNDSQYETYRRAVYLRGAMFFDDLRSLIGDEAFFAFLKDYAAQMAFKRSTPEDFFRILREHTSVDLSELISEYFSRAY